MVAAGCEVVEGIEMLFEQGCAQCEAWTNAPAPRQPIAASLMGALFTAGSDHPASAKMQVTLPPLFAARASQHKARRCCGQPLDAPPTAIECAPPPPPWLAQAAEKRGGVGRLESAVEEGGANAFERFADACRDPKKQKV